MVSAYIPVCSDSNIYKVAEDVNANGAKKYKSFSTYIEFYEYYKKSNHLYELIITDRRKPYFDIDKFELDKDGFNELIDVLVSKVEENYNTEIKPKDVKITVRDETDGMFRSAHVVIDNGTFCKIKSLYDFSDILKQSIPSIDKVVYDVKRCFKYPNMTKFKTIDNKPLKSSYYYGYKDALLYKVSEYEELKKHIISVQSTNSLTEVFGNYIKPINTDKKFKKEKDITVETKDKETVNGAEELYELIKQNYNSKFYTQTNDWRTVTGLLINLNVLKKREWAKLSATHSNKQWTEKQNIVYLEKCDTSKLKNNNIYTVIKITNKYTNKLITFNINKPCISEELCEWVSKYTKLSVRHIQHLFKSEVETDNDIEVVDLCDKKFKYNFKTGFLNEYCDTNACVMVKNFRDEVLMKSHINKTKQITPNFTYDNIDKTRTHVNDFIRGRLDNIAVKAMWGVGKTHTILKPIMEAMRHDYRIIVITENNALNSECQKTFPYLKSHQLEQTIPNSIDWGKDSIIVSVESACRVLLKKREMADRPQKYILFLDESESIFKHLQSSTIKDTRQAYLTLMKLCMKADKCVILDADISYNRIETLMKWRPVRPIQTIDISETDDTKNTLDKYFKLCDDVEKKHVYVNNFCLINITQNNFKDHKMTVYDNVNRWTNMLENDVKLFNKRVCVASASKNKSIDIYNACVKYCEKNKNKNILLINRDGLSQTSCNSVIYTDDVIQKLNVLLDLEAYIKSNDIHIFIYSPSIKTGISINEELFHKCYSYAMSGGVSAREMLQMLFRARKLIDKEHHIFIGDGWRPLKSYATLQNAKDSVIANGVVANSNSILKKTETEYEIMKEQFMCDDEYLTVIANNVLEQDISDKNFNQDIMTRLLYNHCIDITYDNNTVKEDYENEIVVQASSRKDKEIYEIADCTLISEEQYKLIKEKICKQKNVIKLNKEIDVKIEEIVGNDTQLSPEDKCKIEDLEKSKQATSHVSREDKLKYRKYYLLDTFNTNDHSYIRKNTKYDDVIYEPQTIDFLIPNEIRYDFFKQLIKPNRSDKFVTLNKIISNQDYFHSNDGFSDELYDEEDYRDENDDDVSDISEIEDISEKLGISNEKKNKYDITKVLLDTLTTKLDVTMTNVEFNTYIDDNLDKIVSSNMRIYFDKCYIGGKFEKLQECKSPLKKKQRELIKIVLNYILKNANYKIQYVNRNTTGPKDKLSIHQYNKDEFVINKPSIDKRGICEINNEFIQPLNVKKQASKLGGGYVYHENFKEVLKLQKSGNIKITLKPNYDKKVYKHCDEFVKYLGGYEWYINIEKKEYKKPKVFKLLKKSDYINDETIDRRVEEVKQFVKDVRDEYKNPSGEECFKIKETLKAKDKLVEYSRTCDTEKYRCYDICNRKKIMNMFDRDDKDNLNYKDIFRKCAKEVTQKAFKSIMREFVSDPISNTMRIVDTQDDEIIDM